MGTRALKARRIAIAISATSALLAGTTGCGSGQKPVKQGLNVLCDQNVQNYANLTTDQVSLILAPEKAQKIYVRKILLQFGWKNGHTQDVTVNVDEAISSNSKVTVGPAPIYNGQLPIYGIFGCTPLGWTGVNQNG